MKKKLLSLVLAVTMLAGASMTAFATDDDGVIDKLGEGAPITLEGTVEKPVIEVTITQGDGVVANPYGLTVAGVTIEDEYTLAGSMIKFVNGSNAPIEVGLKGTVSFDTPSTDKAKKVTVATDTSSFASSTTKQLYVQAEIVDNADKYGVVDEAEAYRLLDKKDKAVTLVYSEKGTTLETNPVLAASRKGADVEANKTKTVDTMVLAITGATATSPTVAWGDEDSFKVITVYDLKLAKEPSVFTKIK